MAKTPKTKTGIFAVILSLGSGVAWIIQRVADIDFVIQTIDDPSWIGKLLNWFAEDADRILGLFMVIGLSISLYVYRQSRKSAKEEDDRSPPDSDLKQLVPDWKIVEAMDYIAAIYGNENEESLDTKYAEPTRLLTSKARSGEIQVWGRRIFDDDNAELSQRQMKQSDWEDIELSIWACTTSPGHSHTEPASQQEVQQFTDLHVNAQQIKSIQWRVDTATKYNDPIHEAIVYVARRTGDNDADNFFESTRKALRQAAVNNEIKFRGRKELEGEQGYCDDVYTWIESSYWHTHILNEMATDRNYESHEHTKARDLKTELRRNRYWGLRVNMDEVKKEWP